MAKIKIEEKKAEELIFEKNGVWHGNKGLNDG